MLNINATEVTIIRCEKCGIGLEFSRIRTRKSGFDKGHIVGELRRKGWAIGKKCLCPRCRETPREWHLRHSGA